MTMNATTSDPCNRNWPRVFGVAELAPAEGLVVDHEANGAQHRVRYCTKN